MSRSIQTSIQISAPTEKVWRVLMDFPNYRAWNPFIKSISGAAEVGRQIEAVIQPPGRAAQTFKPIVIANEPNKLFVWRGSLPIPGLFNGEHRFALTAERGGTRFDHSESFCGLLVPMLGGVLKASEQGFREMNQALRMIVEAR